MDESSLRKYFRKVLGVTPGASRKELRKCRDKRAQYWRAALIAPQLGAFPEPKEGQAAADTAEGRLAITNTAYACLGSADKFREFQSRLAAGDCYLPDLDQLLLALGESNQKPVAPRVLAKRQAQVQEKMDRIAALIKDSVKQAGHDQALKVTGGKLPDADSFYDQVYKVACDAGNKTLAEELEQITRSNFELDETFTEELSELVVDQSEMIAHKESDRLEDRAARSAPTPVRPRIIALCLSFIVLGLVIGACLWGATTQPTATPYIPPAATTANPSPTAAPAAMPAAPAPGIANSVFNKSTFGPANPQVVNAATNQAPAVPYQPNSAPPALSPAPVAVVVSVPDAEIKAAEEVTPSSVAVKPPADNPSIILVGYAGAAGLAGPATSNSSPGGKLYASGDEAAIKGAYVQSARDFEDAYNLGHDKEALYNKGVVMALQGQWQQAVPVYSQALTHKPVLVQAIYNRASAHQWLAHFAWLGKNYGEWRNQLSMAIKNYSLAIKADPRMSQAYYNRGLAYYEFGEFEKSSADFSKANQILPAVMEAARYNRDLVDFAAKKISAPPTSAAPPAPIGPVGPAGPA